MSKGIVIHLDNDKEKVLDPAKNLFDQSNFEFEYVICQSNEEFKQIVSKRVFELKAIIFDLINDGSEAEINKNNPNFIGSVLESFSNYNIPIFIYSGFLQSLEGVIDNSHGTVYKIDKANEDINFIFDKIKLLAESGFIEIFSPGGIIENEISRELNLSFRNQFLSNEELEGLINSILEVEGDLEIKKERLKKVFKRITIKSLFNDLLAPVADGEDNVHPIEHFYRRQSKLKMWTGDIWKNKSNGDHALILTPRCDFALRTAENIMFCLIEQLEKPIKLTGTLKEKEQNLRNYLTGNQGKAKRYIPANSLFKEGGNVILNKHFVLPIETFIHDFEYVATLSDDLTNEIIGMFAYYFLRTGITNINQSEFEAILNSLKE